MKSEQNRVIIIGAGIAGTFAALYLNRKGYEVTLVDRQSGTENCSYGNAGMIVPSHIIPLASPGIISKGLRWMLNAESPFYVKPRLSLDLLRWGWEFKKASTGRHVDECAPVLMDLLMETRELLVALEQEESLSFDLQKRGLFMFCQTEKELENERRTTERAKSLGMPAEILTPDEVKEKEPNLEIDIIGASWYPKDAHLHPGALMEGVKKVLGERGVEFKPYTEITALQSENGRVTAAVTQNNETLKGRHFLLCTGAWSASLIRSAGIRLPMQGGKGYSISLKEPPKMPVNCGILAEAKVTMTPMFDILRFGGTMEIAGNDMSVTPKKLLGLKKSVCRYLPDFRMEHLEGHDVWAGLRPCTPDGMPYVGRLGSLENLYCSTGHAMMGMSLGPSCGHRIASLIAGEKTNLSPKVDPNRFS
ncbi:MAG: FAD-dependent oxidoreductase [Balneolaceae bacterium]